MVTQVNAWQAKDGLLFLTSEEAETYEKFTYETLIDNAIASALPPEYYNHWSDWPGTMAFTRAVFDALTKADLLK